MTRRTRTRIACVLLAPWLAITVAGPGASACTMRGVHVASAMPDMPGMPGMPDADGARTKSPTAPGQHSSSTSCCIGACCCAVAPQAPADAPELSLAATTATCELAVGDADGIAPAAADHLLPFANGPPAARI
jgi:hypothetical protein